VRISSEEIFIIASGERMIEGLLMAGAFARHRSPVEFEAELRQLETVYGGDNQSSVTQFTPQPRVQFPRLRTNLGDAQKLLLHFMKPRRDAVVPFWME
jgi:hypothetical protein